MGRSDPPAAILAERYRIRRAGPADADRIAALFSASFRLLTFLPMRHTLQEDRAFIGDEVMPHADVYVAEDEGGIASFITLRGEFVRLLHTRPDRLSTGAGSQLVNYVQSIRGALELWCFQANHVARRLYERHGFRPVEFTAGLDNEEQMPDVRYRWERAD